MIERSKWNLAIAGVVILGLCMLPACDFLGLGTGNGNANTNENNNDNSNTNDNDNGNTNDNENANSNENGNDNTGEEEFAVFTDPETGFTTTVVYDSNRDTAQFRVTDDSVVFQDGMAYDIGEWEVNGNILDAEQFFQVRFGTEDGERRAFFTETEMPDVVCDFFVEDGDFQMVPSTHPVPGD